MSSIALTITVDTRALERDVIPALVAFGRRTIGEQCVTSATFIALDWQRGIRAVDVAKIDSELDEVVRVSRGRSKFGQTLGGLPWTRGMMIAVQRTNPNSPFSLATGNRWPVAYAGGLKGVQRWRFFADVAERMQTTRHSSTHFLQAGCTPIVRKGLASPLYKYNAAFGSRRAAGSAVNQMNTTDPDALGDMVIDLTGDQCVVTGSNDIGEVEGDSNSVVAAKHRRALIEYGVPPLEAAVAKETAAGQAELQRRMDLGWKMKYPQW